MTIRLTKRFFVLALICLSVFRPSYAQEQTFDIEDGLLMLNVLPDEKPYTNMRVGITRKQLIVFMKYVKKFQPKLENWAETAKRENVSKYKKDLDKAFFADYISFEVDGLKLDRVLYHSGWHSHCLLWLYFTVDSQRVPYFELRTLHELSPIRLTDGKTTETTTTVAGHVGRVTTRNVQTYPIDQFHLSVPIDQLNDFVSKIEEKIQVLEEKKDERERQSKLFK